VAGVEERFSVAFDVRITGNSKATKEPLLEMEPAWWPVDELEDDPRLRSSNAHGYSTTTRIVLSRRPVNYMKGANRSPHGVSTTTVLGRSQYSPSSRNLAFGLVRVRTNDERLLVFTNSGQADLKEAYAYKMTADGENDVPVPDTVVKV
jgi:hypothetical protein